MRIDLSIPLIGPLLLRRTVRSAGRAVRAGSLQAVRTLASVAAACPDTQARFRAMDALRDLPSQESIDAFCREVIRRQNPELEKLAVSRHYAPGEPGERALFFFIIGQDEALRQMEPDAHHPHLAGGYAAAPSWMRERALRKAMEGGNCRTLARALAGRNHGQYCGRWTYGEWEVVLTGLADTGAWEDVWQIIPSAPPSLAVRILKYIRESGHMPRGDMREVAEELLRDLPESWIAPFPDRPLRTISSPDSRCTRIVISHDNAFLAAGTSDGRVMVWQISGGRLLVSCPAVSGVIHFLSFTSDNSCLVVGGDHGTLAGFDIPSGAELWRYEQSLHPVTSVRLSGDGRDVLAGDVYGNVIRVTGKTGDVLGVIPGHPSRVTALCQNRSTGGIITGHEDGTVCCHDHDTGNSAWKATVQADPVRETAVTDGGDLLLVMHERAELVFHDIASGEKMSRCSDYPGRLACHALSEDAKTVIIGSGDNVLRVWTAEGRKPVTEIALHNRLPTCCAISRDGTMAACGCNEGTQYYYSIPDGRCIYEGKGFRQPVACCAISADNTVYAAASADGTVTIRSIPSGRLLRTLRRPAGSVTALAISRGLLVSGTTDGTVRFVSAADGSLIRAMEMYTPSVTTIATSRDGRYLACAGSDSSLRIWDIPTGSLLASCQSPKTTIRCLAFLPAGNTFVSGGWDGIMRFWNVPDGRLVKTLPGHKSIVTSCCTDPESKILVTSSNDTTVQIHDLTGKNDVVVIRDGKKEVTCCAVSPCGSLVATAGPDPVLHLYSLPEGRSAGTIPRVPGLPTALSFTGDGLALAAGYQNGTLAYYSVHDRSLIRTLSAHTGQVTGIVTLPEGNSIATSGTDGIIRIFRTPFIRPLSDVGIEMLELVMEQERMAATKTSAGQWRFLRRLLALRLQQEIEICPVFRDAGIFDIQIVG